MKSNHIKTVSDPFLPSATPKRGTLDISVWKATPAVLFGGCMQNLGN